VYSIQDVHNKMMQICKQIVTNTHIIGQQHDQEFTGQEFKGEVDLMS